MLVASSGRRPAISVAAHNPQAAAVSSQLMYFLPFTAMQPVVPQLVTESFQLSAQLWGAVCAAEGLARILCAVPIAGRLAKGRKPVLVHAFLALSLAMLALLHSGSVLTLLLRKLLVGAALLAQNSAMQLYLQDISSPENRSRIMAPVLMAEKLSSVAGPLVGATLCHFYGPHRAMLQLAFVMWLGPAKWPSKALSFKIGLKWCRFLPEAAFRPGEPSDAEGNEAI